MSGVRTRTSGILVNVNILPPLGPGSLNAWDPTHASASTFTFSNSNLTETQTANDGTLCIGRAVDSAAAGKFYWEISVLTQLNINEIHGICSSNQGLLIGDYVGDSINSLGWDQDGRVLQNNVNLGPIQTFAVGDVLGIAVDIGNGLIWFHSNSHPNWNNSGTANPATGVGGISYSTTSLFGVPNFAAFASQTANDTTRANFGALPFTLTQPSGFYTWP